MTQVADPYRVLGLERGASHEEIRRAYFRQVREHPPETDPEAFQAIRAAYEQVRSAEQRVVTDIYLLKAPPPWEPPRRPPEPARPGRLPSEAVLAAAKAFTDLAREDFRDDYEAVHL